jgi:hypothetical protein
MDSPNALSCFPYSGNRDSAVSSHSRIRRQFRHTLRIALARRESARRKATDIPPPRDRSGIFRLAGGTNEALPSVAILGNGRGHVSYRFRPKAIKSGAIEQFAEGEPIPKLSIDDYVWEFFGEDRNRFGE